MTDKQRKQYQDKADKQLQAWVEGKPFATLIFSTINPTLGRRV